LPNRAIDRFPWKFLLLFDDYCETGYQQKQIWWLEASLPQILIFAWPIVVGLNQLSTYSYSCSMFGTLWPLVYGLGLDSRRFEYSNIFRITIFGSPFQQVVVEGCDLFNNLVGCHVCGLYGTREIRNYS
jgi:hypothetical protein